MTTTDPMPAPQSHPAWCDQQHAAEWPVHSVQVGADLDLTGELSYAVLLWQQGDTPTEVHLIRHTDDETTLTRLSLLESAILRDLVSEGLALVGQEVGR